MYKLSTHILIAYLNKNFITFLLKLAAAFINNYIARMYKNIYKKKSFLGVT